MLIISNIYNNGIILIRDWQMKKYAFLIMGLFMMGMQAAFSATEAVVETVSPELETSLKTHANEPGIMSVLFALLVVVLLIYITGLIYSKLNLVGAKTVKEQLRNHDLSRAFVLSTTQLGQGKNLHVIELHDKRYLIGATPNSITLIKELDETRPAKASNKVCEIVENVEGEEILPEFDVHKKYL